MDSFATVHQLQPAVRVPRKFLVNKFGHVRFEPSGWAANQTIPYAKSIPDYIFRWLGSKFLGAEYAANEAGNAPMLRQTESDKQESLPFQAVASDAPTCSECGGMMTRNGRFSGMALVI